MGLCVSRGKPPPPGFAGKWVGEESEVLSIGKDGVASYTRPGKDLQDIGLEGWQPLGKTSRVKGYRDCTSMQFDLHVLGNSRLRVDGRTFTKMSSVG